MTPRAALRVLPLPEFGEGVVRVEVACPTSITGATQISAPGCPALAIESLTTLLAYRHADGCGRCDLADVHAAGDEEFRAMVERASAARRARRIEAYAAERRNWPMLKASLIGNLGGDPESRTSPDGRAFLRMNVACNYRARDQGGVWEDRTEWVRVTVFGQRAEALAQHLRKGSRVYVDGRLEARPWTDRQQQPHAGLEVIATDVQFAGPRVEDERTSGEGRTQGDGPAGPGPSGGGCPPTQPSDADGLEDLLF